MKVISVVIASFCLYMNAYSQVTVTLSKQGTLYLIPCKVNGEALSFIFDTGASDVLLSQTTFEDMKKKGKIRTSDISNQKATYTIANGSNVEQSIIYLREIEIGGLVLNNVSASVSPSLNASLLLGQSAMSKFGEYTFNYKTNILTINSALNVDIKKQLKEYKSKMDTKGYKITNEDTYFQNAIKKENIKREINYSIDFDVAKVREEKREDDNLITFTYDVTNNSSYDYSFVSLGFEYVYIDVITEDGKIYSDKQLMKDVQSGKTVEGLPISINIRSHKIKYFRIYPVAKSSFNL